MDIDHKQEVKRIRMRNPRRVRVKRTWTVVFATMGFAALAASWQHSYAPIRPFLIYYGGLPAYGASLMKFEHRLAGYPVVVLGTGLDEPQSAARIIAWGHSQSRPMHFYGYISIGVSHGGGNLSPQAVGERLQSWRQLGADGVLYDTAGPDFGVSHQRLSTLVTLAHRHRLDVIVNAWSPRAVLSAGLTKQDGYLAENWYAADGKVRSTPSDAGDVTAVINSGILVYMTATAGARVSSPPPGTLASWIAGTSRVARGTYLAVSDENYSSQTNAILPASAITKTVHSFFPFGLWPSTQTRIRQMLIW